MADEALAALQADDAIVPALWGLEVANGLLAASRRGRIDQAELAPLSAYLRSLPIAVDPVERARAFMRTLPLAARRGLSAYDAAYLELAGRLALPLATLDQRLARAAEAEGVRLFG